MKKIKRRGILLILSLLAVYVLFGRGALAEAAGGTWRHNSSGWWYEYSDGSYAKAEWILYDGNWYYVNSQGFMVTDWVRINGKWYYFSGNGKMQTGWMHLNGKWYYFNDSGQMQTGWKEINKNWYLFSGSGQMYTGWKEINGNWYYFRGSGIMQTGESMVGTQKYYFKDSGELYLAAGIRNGVFYTGAGYALKGFFHYGDNYYYAKDDYHLVTNVFVDVSEKLKDETGQEETKEAKKGRRYFGKNGLMQKGLSEVNGKTYYFSREAGEIGVMKTACWIQVSGKWYYFDGSGAMVTGWRSVGGSWYYFRNSGAMATGWFEDQEAEAKLPADQKRAIWYWFDDNGAMATGWKEIDGRWEMFADNGEWLYTWDGN